MPAEDDITTQYDSVQIPAEDDITTQHDCGIYRPLSPFSGWYEKMRIEQGDDSERQQQLSLINQVRSDWLNVLAMRLTSHGDYQSECISG